MLSLLPFFRTGWVFVFAQGDLLERFVKNVDDEVEVLLTMEEEAIQYETWSKLFDKVVRSMYLIEEFPISEEGILRVRGRGKEKARSLNQPITVVDVYTYRADGTTLIDLALWLFCFFFLKKKKIGPMKKKAHVIKNC